MGSPVRKVDWNGAPRKRVHEIIAALDAVGWPTARIAQFVGMSKATIYGLRKQEAYRVACDALAERAKAKIIDTAFDPVRAVAQDAEENIRFLRDVRANEQAELGQRVKVGLAFLDRQAPTKREGDSDPRTVINFDLRDVSGMRAALREDGFALPEPAPVPLPVEPTDEEE